MKIPVLLVLSFLILSPSLQAQEAQPNADLAPMVESVQQAGEGMSMLQILQSGGAVMIALGLLSILMITLAIFLFLRLRVSRLVPMDQAERVITHVQRKNFRQALDECQGRDTLVSSIAVAGLDQLNRGLSAAEEAVELTARKEVSSLWTSLSYLSDIAQIAPMLGLLGTVLGMIQAFNTIAFDAAVVKPILLAGGVSKAMITTAAGLVVAIICMILYSMIRPRVQDVTNRVQTVASQLLEALRK